MLPQLLLVICCFALSISQVDAECTDVEDSFRTKVSLSCEYAVGFPILKKYCNFNLEDIQNQCCLSCREVGRIAEADMSCTNHPLFKIDARVKLTCAEYHTIDREGMTKACEMKRKKSIATRCCVTCAKLLVESTEKRTLPSATTKELCDPTQEMKIGFPVIKRKFVDSIQMKTIVDVRQVKHAGYLDSVMFYSYPSTPLQFGIYREAGADSNKKLILVHAYRTENHSTGVQELKFPKSSNMKVLPGDRIGFSWHKFGVIAFSQTSAINYWSIPRPLEVNDTAEFSWHSGNRIYSLMAYFSCE